MSRLGLFVLGLAFAITAGAEPSGENLLLKVPAGYKVSFQEAQGPILTTEMVPEAESSEAWTEMLTSQMYVGLKSVSPAQFEAESRRKWLEACKEGKFAAITSGDENGYPFAVWMLSCPYSKAPGRPEITWFKALRGADNFYAVQKSTRFDLTREQVAQTMQHLKSITLCDNRVPEKACPKAD